MPRRRQRFSDLERQFRESGGVASPDSRLGGYIKFKKGEVKIKVESKLTGAQRKRYGFAILPFGVTPSDPVVAADRYAAPITAYSNSARTELGLTNSKCGFENVEAATKQDDNFYPAVIRVFVKSGGVSTPKSAVTGKEYNRVNGKTYSVPFGRDITSTVDKKTGTAETTVNEVDEEDKKASLATAVKAANNNVGSISFLPEEFKIGKPDLASPVT